MLRGQQLAVKVLKIFLKDDLAKLLQVTLSSQSESGDSLTKGTQEFSCEAVIWRQLCHPNVLPFYGVYHLADNSARVCLVSPWMENGNIVDFLKQAPETNCVHLVRETVMLAQLLDQLRLCYRHKMLLKVSGIFML